MVPGKRSTVFLATRRTCNVYDVEHIDPILTIASKDPTCRSISPTGSHILIGKDDASAELWNVDEKLLVGSIPMPFYSAKFSYDEKFLAVPTSVGLDIWDVLQCRKVIEWNPKGSHKVGSLEWSPDGSRLLAMYTEQIGPSDREFSRYALLDQNCREIAFISGMNARFSRSGDRIATTGTYGLFTVFDGSKGGPIATVRGRTMEIGLANPSICFSPEGDWMLVNGDPIVFHRTRSERWYGCYQLPAFWGMILFLAALIVQLFESKCGPTSQLA